MRDDEKACILEMYMIIVMFELATAGVFGKALAEPYSAKRNSLEDDVNP